MEDDQLINENQICWLLWRGYVPHHPDFPSPVRRSPHLWSRQAVLRWQKKHEKRSLDRDLAAAFLQGKPVWSTQ